MSGLTQWQENNDRYLSAALAWLRLRLAGEAKTALPAQPEEAPKDGQPTGWFSRRKHTAGGPAPVTESKTESETEKAARAMADAADVEPPPALMILGQRFGLSRFEQEVLLLCTAMELDTRIPGLCTHAHDFQDHPYPTFALAFTVFDNPAWDALSADRPLRYWRLIEINQPGTAPLTMSALRADERIVNYIKGLNQLDDRLTPLLVPFDMPDADEHALAASHQQIAGQVEHSLKQWSTGRLPVIQLTGTDSISKQQTARAILFSLGMHAYRLPCELIPQAAGDLDIFARLWQRESTLLPLALYVDASEPDDGSTPESQFRLNSFLSRCRTLTFLDTREPRTALGLNTISFEIDKPTPEEQGAAWREALGEDDGDSPGQLAGQFNLSLPAIRQIAANALADKIPEESASAVHERLWTACLGRTRPRLDRLAQRIEAKAVWDELVLPAEPLALLYEIAAQVRQRSKVYDAWGFRRMMNRGFGISALFGGESGCGKTMAAEVIANELRLNLYRIDLSAVVSKYIGETEKNLRRVFDAAEDGGVILFFDEADALFGKRSEVKDSHDRYANIEINYLLQRMEAYGGLAILATNMKTALDQAFVRRLRFIVNFPFPGAGQRKLIWERAFPKDDQERNLSGTPVEALDYDGLAKLNLTGGSIHNVALNSAFLAARSGTSVTMPLVLEAARTEFRKLDKPVNESDFRNKKPVEEIHDH